MARSSSRKSSKRCGPRKHGRKAHQRMGKRIKATCVRNPRRKTMKMKKTSRRMRAMPTLIEETGVQIYPMDVRMPMTEFLRDHMDETEIVNLVNAMDAESPAVQRFGPLNSLDEVIRIMRGSELYIPILDERQYALPEGTSRIFVIDRKYIE